MTLSGKKNNLHACARCPTKIVGQVAIDDQEFGAVDSPVWETAFNATNPEKGIPTTLDVYYCGDGNNQMALPHDIGTYFQTPYGWVFEQAER